MLKLIPSEVVTKNHKLPKKKVSVWKQIFERKLQGQQNKDQKIIQFAVIKLQEFVKKGENQGIQEIGDLIDHLQRSILSLQRKRNKIVQKNRKRI